LRSSRNEETNQIDSGEQKDNISLKEGMKEK
jgi:hypothetical protein